MDPYFEIYIPRLTRTLKLSKLRALTKLHNPKRYNDAEDRERWEKSHQHDAANPATVLRLVGMVRFLAFSAARSRGLFDDPAYWLDTAYVATEKLHG